MAEALELATPAPLPALTVNSAPKFREEPVFNVFTIGQDPARSSCPLRRIHIDLHPAFDETFKPERFIELHDEGTRSTPFGITRFLAECEIGELHYAPHPFSLQFPEKGRVTFEPNDPLEGIAFDRSQSPQVFMLPGEQLKFFTAEEIEQSSRAITVLRASNSLD